MGPVHRREPAEPRPAAAASRQRGARLAWNRDPETPFTSPRHKAHCPAFARAGYWTTDARHAGPCCHTARRDISCYSCLNPSTLYSVRMQQRHAECTPHRTAFPSPCAASGCDLSCTHPAPPHFPSPFHVHTLPCAYMRMYVAAEPLPTPNAPPPARSCKTGRPHATQM